MRLDFVRGVISTFSLGGANFCLYFFFSFFSFSLGGDGPQPPQMTLLDFVHLSLRHQTAMNRTVSLDPDRERLC